MLPIVNRLGRNHRPLRMRSFFAALLSGVGFFRDRRSGMNVSIRCCDDPDGTTAAADSSTQSYGYLGTGRKQNVHSRSEANQSNQFSFLDHVANLLPEYNTARHDARNLCENKLDASIANHNDIALVF